jgi:hypothetical protein
MHKISERDRKRPESRPEELLPGTSNAPSTQTPKQNRPGRPNSRPKARHTPSPPPPRARSPVCHVVGGAELAPHDDRGGAHRLLQHPAAGRGRRMGASVGRRVDGGGAGGRRYGSQGGPCTAALGRAHSFQHCNVGGCCATWLQGRQPPQRPRTTAAAPTCRAPRGVSF